MNNSERYLTIEDNVVTKCSAEATKIVIPDGVTEIGERVFFECDSLESITIPDSLVNIGRLAFSCCIRLREIIAGENNPNYTSIDGVLYSKNMEELLCYPASKDEKSFEIPDSVTEIGEGAFARCGSLESVTLPDSVKVIKGVAFLRCESLKSVTIPNSVTKIGKNAFKDCNSLRTVTIPDSVTEIEGGVFSGCFSLREIIVSENNPNYTSIDGALYSKNMKELLCCLNVNEGNSFEIPDGVTKIGDDAFIEWFKLKSITIPDSVTEIGEDAFFGCKKLCEFIVDKNNPGYTSVDGVLYSKNMEELLRYPSEKDGNSFNIPDSVTEIGIHAFYSCDSLESVVIPNSVTEIGIFAFENCNKLKSITLPNSMTEIRYGTFAHCFRLESVTLPNSVTEIENDAFFFCSNLREFIVDKNNPGYTSVNGVLYSKNMEELLCYPAKKDGKTFKIPDGVTKIGDGAFEHCSHLESLTIPDSVTAIGKDAFRCFTTNLCEIIVGKNNPSYTSIDGVLYTRDKKELLRYPASKEGNSFKIPNGVTKIGIRAFCCCQNLKSVVIPNSVTEIGSCAFEDCHQLKSITLPNGVTEIRDGTFESCSRLESLTIPDGVVEIGASAFSHCDHLESITLPNSLVKIGGYAFYKCEILPSLTIPDGVNEINPAIFERCDCLRKIVYRGKTYAGVGEFCHELGLKLDYNPDNFGFDLEIKFDYDKLEVDDEPDDDYDDNPND